MFFSLCFCLVFWINETSFDEKSEGSSEYSVQLFSTEKIDSDEEARANVTISEEMVKILSVLPNLKA